MPAPANRPVDFEGVKQKYVESCPNARPARRFSQLLDAVVRQRVYENPKLDYGQALSNRDG
jgi:hypothetical protein